VASRVASGVASGVANGVASEVANGVASGVTIEWSSKGNFHLLGRIKGAPAVSRGQGFARPSHRKTRTRSRA
jgi:hypothetical protein